MALTDKLGQRPHPSSALASWVYRRGAHSPTQLSLSYLLLSVMHCVTLPLLHPSALPATAEQSRDGAHGYTRMKGGVKKRDRRTQKPGHLGNSSPRGFQKSNSHEGQHGPEKTTR